MHQKGYDRTGTRLPEKRHASRKGSRGGHLGFTLGDRNARVTRRPPEWSSNNEIQASSHRHKVLRQLLPSNSGLQGIDSPSPPSLACPLTIALLQSVQLAYCREMEKSRFLATGELTLLGQGLGGIGEGLQAFL